MARAAKVDRGSGAAGGAASRVAARRRDAWKAKDASDKPAKVGPSKGKPARGKAPRSGGRARGGGGGGSALARVVKLLVLVGAMLCIGFFAVLVVDVGASLVGKVHLGETTVVDLWHKMVNRVLDNDVPRPDAPKPGPAPGHAPARPHAQAPEAERAPLPAARPEEDARHVDAAPVTDPEVQRAKLRLDDLLGRL